MQQLGITLEPPVDVLKMMSVTKMSGGDLLSHQLSGKVSKDQSFSAHTTDVLLD